MDNTSREQDDIAHMARLALTGRPQDVQLYIRRLVRKYKDSVPELAEELKTLLRESPTRQSPLRKEALSPVPVDVDSRLELLRCEHVTELDAEPIFADSVRCQLEQIVSERRNQTRLINAGLAPTKTALFTGPPGVGKTLSARWLARELTIPLLILDLSAVMSSFLGRTGNNLRNVLDYAKSTNSILLIDELDALAKRRDDSTEIGELKRLVTVLLQEVDDWPATGLLIAATNHADLLDPAVWRRFEVVVEFPMPESAAVRAAIEQFLGGMPEDCVTWANALVACLDGTSFSDIQRDILRARRSAVLSEASSLDVVMKLVSQHVGQLPRQERIDLATRLVEAGTLSQRQAHELTGVSRDTIRKGTSGRIAAND